MIEINGIQFQTIDQPIYANGKRVSRVYVNGLQVYPGVKRGDKVNRYAMFFEFSQDVISMYSPEPVNQYGVYADIAGGFDSVYRVAFFVDQSGGYPRRQLFVSYEGYRDGPEVMFVPYIAKDGYIVTDGKQSASINTFVTSRKTSGSKVYYSTDSVGANLTDVEGNYLANYSISASSENVEIFMSQDSAINYVLS